MASVLVVVGLISALTAISFAVHGREVAVPDFRNETPVEARAAAEDLGLATEIERQYYSPSISEGRVVSQMPEPGTLVRRGWEVRLALSLGPQRVAIPSVIGESERAASINLAQRGLQVGGTAYAALSGIGAGNVIAQDPPANATGISAPKISLLVEETSAPQAFVMPSFIGRPLGTVSNELQDAGFVVGKISSAPSPTAPEPSADPQVGAVSPSPTGAEPMVQNPSPASIIVSQDPPPGTKVTDGSAINFVVR